MVVCRQHPWFNLHLPRYLAVTQAQAVITPGLVDPDMVEVVVRMGFQRDYVMQSVKEKVHNKVRSPSYYLSLQPELSWPLRPCTVAD